MLWTDGRILDFALKTVDKGKHKAGVQQKKNLGPRSGLGGAGSARWESALPFGGWFGSTQPLLLLAARAINKLALIFFYRDL